MTDASPEHTFDVLADVSAECFDGGPVPADLARLWTAQEDGDTDLLDSFELVLLTGINADDAVAPFEDDPTSDPAAVAALRRFCEQVVFVAEALDSTLLGYWVPIAASGEAIEPEAEPGALCVVVAVDANGQVAVQGLTIAEALISLTDPDEPDEADEVVAELVRLGIEPGRRTVEEIFAALDALPDPNELILAYLLDARLAGPTGT